jgi:PHD/YefM family antitoxin component YafN of YafNO toxin-antitoxin module
MDFVTVRELTSSPREMWARLKDEQELVITNNGKPSAIMLNIDETNLNETLRSIHQARSMRLITAIWDEAAVGGGITDAEIEAEIEAARKERVRDNA